MALESARIHQFDPQDVKDTDVMIYSVSFAGNAYGRDPRAENQGSIFFNKSITTQFDLKPGDVVRARYVPNYPDRAEVVPWRAIFVFGEAEVVQPEPASVLAEPPVPQASVVDRVHALLSGGGVWTVATAFEWLFPGKSRVTSVTEYNAVSAALRSLFARGHCAKFQLWRSPDQTKPGREWFTCYPEKADVDEFEEK